MQVKERLLKMNDKNEWVPLKYKDIIKDIYEVNMNGRIRNKNNKKELFGCNPKNEKGYVRVTLQTNDGYKKFPLHRLIISTFYMNIDEYEVNHIDGDKLNNSFYNLEYTDRLGNAVHAKENQLYQSCEDHYKATLSNKEVEKICELMQGGASNISIMNILGLNVNRYMNILSKIRHRKSWTNISDKYTWDDGLVYKKYTKDDIFNMCKYIHVDNMKISDVIKLFPQYKDKKKLNNILKKIKQKKLYKRIIFQVICSTTIETNMTI